MTGSAAALFLTSMKISLIFDESCDLLAPSPAAPRNLIGRVGFGSSFFSIGQRSYVIVASGVYAH
jgi:hypothetical protein